MIRRASSPVTYKGCRAVRGSHTSTSLPASGTTSFPKSSGRRTTGDLQFAVFILLYCGLFTLLSPSHTLFHLDRSFILVLSRTAWLFVLLFPYTPVPCSATAAQELHFVPWNLCDNDTRNSFGGAGSFGQPAGMHKKNG